MLLNCKAILKSALLGWALSYAAQAVPVVTLNDLVGDATSIPNFVHGWQFTTNSDISVTALGFFDEAQDGLVDAHDVGIFSAAGTLLASATVPSGLAAPLINQFRYVAIAPLLLASGQTFRIGAIYNTGSDRLIAFNPTGLAIDPAITKSPLRFFVNSATLADPSGSAAGNGSFGPNFDFVLAATGAPEINGLSSVALGFTFLLLSLAEGRRKAPVAS